VTLRPYPVEQIEPEWVYQREEMGSKTKFWFRRPNDRTRLFKYPHENTGEHWAEKISAEIANLLGIPHAKVRLATFQGERGSSSLSFIQGSKRELYHGNQVLAGALYEYDTTRRFGQSDHNLPYVLGSLDYFFIDPDARKIAKVQLATYLILDALIGNTDRHHENWGVVYWPDPTGGFIGDMAPTFDHASSLGRELKDAGGTKSRTEILRNAGVGRYSEKARGGIYWESSDARAPSPLELIRHARNTYPEIFVPALRRLEKLRPETLKRCIARIPPDWITDTAQEFAFQLLCYNLSELRKLVQ